MHGLCPPTRRHAGWVLSEGEPRLLIRTRNSRFGLFVIEQISEADLTARAAILSFLDDFAYLSSRLRERRDARS